MKWRGVGAVVVLLILFVGAAAASPVTIQSPTTGVQPDNSPTIHLTADSGYRITAYTLNPGGDTTTVNNATYEDSKVVSQGRHQLAVNWVSTDGNTSGTVTRNFTVDTNAPQVTYKSPAGTAFNRHPTLTIKYNDAVSSIDTGSVAVWLDGERINGNTTDSAFTTDLTNISEGTHNVSITLSDSVGNAAQPVTWSFTLPKKPIVSNTGPTGLIDGNDATVTVSMQDPSGIDASKSDIRVYNEDKTVLALSLDTVDGMANKTVDSRDGTKIAVSHALKDLDDGVYTVEAHITDSEGHTTKTTWHFTVDTTAPSVNILSHNDGDIVTGTQTFVVKAVDALSKVGHVKVSLGDEHQSAYTGVDNKFHMDLDTNTVGDGTKDLYVSAYDAADNKATKHIQLLVDNTAPTVRDIEVYPKTVPVKAKILATVQDDATGIESVSYKVKNTDMTGTLVPVDGAFDESTEDVYGMLDVEQLAPGQHTVYVIARDGAGHTTTKHTTFTVDHAHTATLSLKQQDPVLVDAGNSKTFTIRVSNTGEADDLVSLASSASIVTKLRPTEKRVHAGETKGFDVSVNVPGDATLGPRDLPITIQGFGTTTHASVPVSVQPKPTAQQHIKQQLQDLKNRFSSLSSSKNKYADRVNAQDTGTTFNETQETLTNIQTLIDNGQYYAASQKIDDAQSQMSDAKTALSGMITRYKHQQLMSTLFKALAVLLFLGVAVGLYRLTPDEEGFDSGNGFIFHEDDRHPVVRKWDEIRQNVQDWLAQQRSDEGTARSHSESRQPNSWNGFEN